jgi:proteasome lid subunit RPN8/RPN11
MAEASSEIQLWSAEPEARLLPRHAWPLTLRYEVAVLAAADGVRADSICVYEHCAADGGGHRWVIACAIERDDPATTVEARILSVEPVALVYPAGEAGTIAPNIYSERFDFPRDLPHLNPVGVLTPASPCIAREGTQVLYDRGGITLVITELVSWLTDAAAGVLERDGWEPMPLWGTFELSADLAWFQETAFRHGRREACLLHGLGQLVFAERDGRLVNLYVNVQTPGKKLSDLVGHEPIRQVLTDGVEREGLRADVPWIFMAGSSNQPISRRVARELDSEEALRDAATMAHCNAELTRAFREILPRLREGFRIHVCLLIGTWRPAPLIPDIPGMAQGEARHCELSACCVKLGSHNGSPTIERVYPLRIVAAPSRTLLAQTSGLKREPASCALVGCGALGAKLGEFLVREGIAQLTLVDPDVLAPHNLARHSLGRSSLGLPKAKELKLHLERIAGVEPDLCCRARTMRIDQWDDKGLNEALGKQPRWVIDATADARAARRLVQSGQSRPVIRVELADDGKLGLMAAEGIHRNPRLDDLQATLYRTALDQPEVAVWLERDAGLAPAIVGVGCASATMRLPDSTVALHAASLMPSINTRLTGDAEGGGLCINRLDSAGQPMGLVWVDVPPFESLRAEATSGDTEPWELRIHPTALETIGAATHAAHPREAGGFLYGRFDVRTRTLTVVEAVALQPLRATETELVLPPAGQSSREQEIIDCCGTVLYCVGPWHSHTTGDATWSGRDRAQAEAFARANSATPQPIIMLISSPADRKAYLILPEIM